MNFLQTILQRCSQASAVPVLQEARDGGVVAASGEEFLALVNLARAFLRKADLKRGDRCALLASNSIRWAALDLAIIAEGAVVVPLYSRQAPSELVDMMKDSSPSLICCGDGALRDSIAQLWPESPTSVLFDEIFEQRGSQTGNDAPHPLADSDAVTIIYTSGTSGEAKGVILTAGNVNFMLRRTSGRLDALMGSPGARDRVFHYLPCCFAGSWILLLTSLSRNSVLTLSTDLTKLADEMKLAAPNYFLNVPALLERMKTGIEGQFEQWGGARKLFFDKGREAWLRRRTGQKFLFGFLWLTAAETFIFPAIKKKISPSLKALICGSAPLSLETQLFFAMLSIEVLQVYGLTETTAICTMDHPHRVEPGRVGPAIEGIEMKLGNNDEILVRGPNIFQGYWNRPQATSDALRDGCFHTGDQGEIDAGGNWRVTGRIKNLIVLGSGHNVAPEPLEEALLKTAPGAQQVLVVGTGRSFLSAIFTGDVASETVDAALEAVNSQLPHYRRIRAFCLHKEPFTVDNGLLTANGKLKRDLIAERLRDEIEEMYREKKV
jgi:long-chain acyl-CoA synthetase